MKTAFRLFILGLGLAFVSCGEDDPDDVKLIEQEGMLMVSVSGSSTVDFKDDTLTAYLHAGLFIVKAEDASGTNIWLLMDRTKITDMVGQHTVARTDGQVQINFNMGDGSHYYSAQSGVVTVTEYTDTFVKGTFSFEANDPGNTSSTITGANGVFSSTIK